MARKRIKAGARQRDVAAAAGVSTATVSAVVNGRAEQYGICWATQEKVRAVIRQLGYSPSLAALDMVAGRNSLVGLAITADCAGADRLIAALEPALVGLRLIVISLPADPPTAAARITDLARFGVAGLAIYPPRTIPLPKLGCPIVMVGKAGVGLRADCSPIVVNQLGQATARWFQLTSQGTPSGELLLEPTADVGTTTPPVSSPVSPRQPPVPPLVTVTAPPVTEPDPVPPATEAATDIVPTVEPPAATPVSEPAETPATILENPANESQPESPISPSESIQMPETVVSDSSGQIAGDQQNTAPEEVEERVEMESELVTPSVESIPITIPMPTPDPVPQAVPESTLTPTLEPVVAVSETPAVEPPPVVSEPVVTPVVPEPIPEPVPVPTPEVQPVEAEPVPAPVPEPTPTPVPEVDPTPEPQSPPPVTIPPAIIPEPVIIKTGDTAVTGEPEAPGDEASAENPAPSAP